MVEMKIYYWMDRRKSSSQKRKVGVRLRNEVVLVIIISLKFLFGLANDSSPKSNEINS